MYRLWCPATSQAPKLISIVRPLPAYVQLTWFYSQPVPSMAINVLIITHRASLWQGRNTSTNPQIQKTNEKKTVRRYSRALWLALQSQQLCGHTKEKMSPQDRHAEKNRRQFIKKHIYIYIFKVGGFRFAQWLRRWPTLHLRKLLSVPFYLAKTKAKNRQANLHLNWTN